jgi:hypothetical protein
MRRIEMPGQEKDHESKGENSCEPARPFGAGDLLGMRRMPLDALFLFGGVLLPRVDLRKLPRFCAEYVGPDFQTRSRNVLSHRRRRQGCCLKHKLAAP